MAARLNRGLITLLAGIAAICIVLAGGWMLIERKLDPKPETIAAASLQGLREQNRLSAFAARFVAVVTSQQTRFGVLTAKKTLIMPGTVRYEVDLSKLSQKDVRWDAKAGLLMLTLPPIEIAGPEIDLTQVREYDGGGILLRLTNAGADLDAANRRAGQAELLKQARESVTLQLARDATRRAVERSFAMPLAAVGIEAKVKVRFADEPKPSDERWDTSRTLDQVLGNRN